MFRYWKDRRSCKSWCICLGPRTWPLARLTIPLEGLSKQIDRLLEGYYFQILATNRDPEAHNGRVLQTATHLTWILAEYLADIIACLMLSILGHASKILFDKDTQLLLTPKFWILPLYRELLNSARRIRPSPSSERARGCTGLVKVICKENKEQKGKRKYHAGTPHPNDRGGFTQWFGSCSLMSTLCVWFPACWAPMVAAKGVRLSTAWSVRLRASPDVLRSAPLAPTQSGRCWFQWVNWDLNCFTYILEPRSFLAPLLSTHSALLTLLLDLGSHFTRALITALLAPNGHFPRTPCYPHWPASWPHHALRPRHLPLRQTYSASLLLVVLFSILDINCVLTAEPNLIEIIDILLQDASKTIWDQYARCLANQVKSSSSLDCTPEDRSQLLRNDSSLRCLLITQGSLLRDLCREHPAFQTFLTTCKVAINDEAQQGGQARSTILASFLDRRCLQLLIGDKEQTRSGTGGEPTKEALLTKLAMKSIGFLHSPFPSLPSEFVEKLSRALRPLPPFSNLLPADPDVHCLLSLLLSNTYPSALCPATVHQAEGVTAISDIVLNLILPQSLRCPADPYFTQVATHYPHLHRQLDDGLVHYGHFEDTPAEVQETRIYHDAQYPSSLFWLPRHSMAPFSDCQVHQYGTTLYSQRATRCRSHLILHRPQHPPPAWELKTPSPGASQWHHRWSWRPHGRGRPRLPSYPLRLLSRLYLPPGFFGWEPW